VLRERAITEGREADAVLHENTAKFTLYLVPSITLVSLTTFWFSAYPLYYYYTGQNVSMEADVAQYK
jgi:hypothetical protein